MAQPKYIGLTNELRKEVLSGRYGPEGGLPSVRDLAQRFSVATNTVQSAMHILESEGLIIRREKKNFYVNGIEITMTQHVPLPPSRLHNRVGYVKTIRVTTESLPDYVKSKLSLPPDERNVVIRDQVSGEVNGKDRPLQLTTRYYLLPLSDEQVHRLEQDSGWDPMWDITSVLQSRDEICSRLATAQESEQLNLPDGTPVIAVFEVIRDTRGTLLMAQEITLSPRDTLVFEFSFENKP